MFNKLFRENNKYKAEKAFNRAIEHYGKNELNAAISLFDRAIQLDSKNAVYYLNRGSTNHKLEKDDISLEDFKMALNFVNLGDTDLLFEIYCGYGISLRQTGRLDDAISRFSDAIKVKPKDIMAYVNRAIVFGLKEDFDNSILDYSKVIALAPNWYGAYNNRANHYKQLKRFQLAIDDYESSVRLAPPNINMESIMAEIKELKKLGTLQTVKSRSEDTNATIKNQNVPTESHGFYQIVNLFKERSQKLVENIRSSKSIEWEFNLNKDNGEKIGMCFLNFNSENSNIIFTVAVNENLIEEIESLAKQFLFLGTRWVNFVNTNESGFKVKGFNVSPDQMG